LAFYLIKRTGRLSCRCKLCLKAFQKDWTKRNPDKLQKWRKANPAKKRKYSKEEYQKYKPKRYYAKIKLKKWGLTLEDLDKAFERQNGKCGIC